MVPKADDGRIIAANNLDGYPVRYESQSLTALESFAYHLIPKSENMDVQIGDDWRMVLVEPGTTQAGGGGGEVEVVENFDYFQLQADVKSGVESRFGTSYDQYINQEFPSDTKVRSLLIIKEGLPHMNAHTELVVVSKPKVIPVEMQYWIDKGYDRAVVVYFGAQDHPNPVPVRVGFYNTSGEYVPDLDWIQIDGEDPNTNFMNSVDRVAEKMFVGRHLWINQIAYTTKGTDGEEDWNFNTGIEGTDANLFFMRERKSEASWRVYIDSTIEPHSLAYSADQMSIVPAQFVENGMTFWRYTWLLEYLWNIWLIMKTTSIPLTHGWLLLE